MTNTTALPSHELPGAGARCAVHPERPARVTCSRCGNFACEACETRSPDTGQVLCKACEDAGDGARIPWEERERLGIPTAFLQTTLAILLRPWEFFALRPREASILPAIFYGWVIALPSNALGMVTDLLSLESQRAQLLANPLTREWLWIAEPPFHIALGLLGPLLYPLVLGLYAVIWHLSLLPFGAAQRPFAETARGLAYVNAVAVPMLVILPVVGVLNVLNLAALGGLVTLPFSIYAWAMAGIAMWKVHRVEGWRVFAAVGAQVTFLVVVSCILAGIVVAAVFASMPFPLAR